MPSAEQQDTGWAWVILFASTMWNFIVGGTLKTYGMLYVEFQTMFPNTPAEIGFMGLVCGVMTIIISPVAGHLCDRYSTRIMVLVGSVLATAGIALVGQATSLLGGVVAFGLLFGSSLGIADGPFLTMLGKYFVKKRNFAYGVAFAGSSVGNIVIAQLMAVAIDAYTIRGAMFILAAVWAHTAVLGSLLRPIHIQSPSTKDVDIQKSPDCTFPRKEIMSMPDVSRMDYSGGDNILLTCHSPEKNIQMLTVCDKYVTKSKSDSALFPDKTSQNTHIKNHTNSSITKRPHESQHKLSKEQPKSCLKWLCKLRKRVVSYLSFLYNARLQNTLFLVGCGMYGYFGTITALPAYLQELGFSRHMSAWFLLVFASVEIVGRVLISWMVDRWRWRPCRVLCVSMIITGVCSQLFVFHPTFPVILCYACVHGFLGGLSPVLMSSLLCESAGVERLGSSMGLSVMQLNLTSAVSSLTAGVMLEMTGTYANAVRLCSFFYLLGAAVYMVLSVLIERRHRRQACAPHNTVMRVTHIAVHSAASHA